MKLAPTLIAYVALPLGSVALAQAPDAPAGAPFEGRWVGQYQTRQALHGRLELSVVRGDGGYELEVISSNEHYPSDEPEELSDVSLEAETIRWTLFFGPNRVDWTGRLDGDFIVGELRGGGGDHPAFKGYWTAVRQAAAVRPSAGPRRSEPPQR